MIQYDDLIGKPFKYGGRGPDEYDCFGLALELHKRNGIILPDYPSSEDPQEQCISFIDGVDKFYEPVEVPESLDIIMFQIVPKFVSHCGIYIGYGKFIHITRRIAVAVEELGSPVWQDKVRGIYRFRGNL